MSSRLLHISASDALRTSADLAKPRVRASSGASGTAIRCAGEFDAGTCAPLGEALERAAEGDAERVLVDLSAATFVDCQTLTLLLAAAHRLADRGGTLVITVGRGQPQRLLELTGVADLLAPAGRRRRDAQAG